MLPTSIRGIICGPSNCGKTNVLISLLESPHGVRFENVYIYSKSLQQPKYQYLESILSPIEEIGYFTFSNNSDVVPPNEALPNSIFVFDDVACDKQDVIREYFAMGRHAHVDCFYLCQTIPIVYLLTRLIGKLRRAELRNTNLQEEEQEVDDSHNGAGISETQLDSFQWLRRCLEPQSEATVKWKETASVRLLKLRSTEYRRKKRKQFICGITEYFNEFRVLRQPWGYILLEQDFNHLYPNNLMQLLSNWEKVVPKIKKLKNYYKIHNC
ncbi:PREDICTED: uncharacterized protein LOC105456047 [Wasmannia auropunctata]|uniref:uncharacterized protein LOC105456047 n=1 Tax=Wasmannia auropunctata TaxID=64793 RepID=UPI0005EE253F|nr:PREDICTED: uncharacterized protein LOC105456047 [Wasmannia auropunctata]